MLRWILFGSLLMAATTLLAQTKTWLLVGNYTEENSDQGINVFSYDSQNGKTLLVNTTKADNPSFLIFNQAKTRLYTVNESEFGSVSAYSFDNTTGQLTLINQKLTGGSYPCHLALSPNEKSLTVGNYGDGTISHFVLNEDGSLASIKQFLGHEGMVGPNKARQEGPHVHQVVFSSVTEQVLVPDLGIDRVNSYTLSEENRLLQDSINDLILPPGAGPRHVAISQTGEHAYVVGELDGQLYHFTSELGGTNWKKQNSYATYPIDFNGSFGGAEISFSPDKRFILVSNRGTSNTIAVFKRDISYGQLSPARHFDCGGLKPRHFSFDPQGKFLLVANEESGNIAVLRYKKRSGKLKNTHRDGVAPHPVCVVSTAQ